MKKKKFPSNYFDSDNTIKIGDIESGHLLLETETLLIHFGLMWEDKSSELTENIYSLEKVRDFLNESEANRKHIAPETIAEIEELYIAMATKTISYIRIITI